MYFLKRSKEIYFLQRNSERATTISLYVDKTFHQLIHGDFFVSFKVKIPEEEIITGFVDCAFDEAVLRTYTQGSMFFVLFLSFWMSRKKRKALYISRFWISHKTFYFL